MMEKAIEIVNETDGLEPYLDNFSGELSNIRGIYESSNKGLEEIYKALSSTVFSRLKSIKRDKVQMKTPKML